MAKISLKNFRKFETLEPLEMGWINLFVGKNNAGKSTVVKAIMLVLDNLRSLRWDNLSKETGMSSVLNVPTPVFRFDANGFHNLHIGTFGRAKCNYVDDKRMTIAIEYEDFEFEITIAGNVEGEQVAMPIEKLKIARSKGGNFEFDFSTKSMKYELGTLSAVDTSLDFANECMEVNKMLADAENELKEAASQGDAMKAAELQSQVQKYQLRKKVLFDSVKKREGKTVLDHATFNLSYFHDNIGENILVQYLRAFVWAANSPISSNIRKNTKAYKQEEMKRLYVKEKVDDIKQAASDLEKLLNNINVEYIQAHAATQKLILSTDDRQDINSRVIHEYYQENIQPGEKADMFVKRWLKEFEIGEGISIKPLEGEGYYVKVNTGDGEVHLADMGMGSIQLIILLLRLATIGHRSDKTSLPWWIFIEEPEQNLHPMLQSRLADFFHDFTQTFCDPYSNTLIVETHSEYLIRRTQVMVAEMIKEYGNDDIMKGLNPFRVYYFPTERGKQPYDMEYLPNGMFANKFDSGFFDEAGKMHMQILKNSKK